MRFLLTLSILAAGLSAQQITGNLTLAGKATALNWVTACEEEDPFDDKKMRIVVMMAAKAPAGPSDCRALRFKLAGLSEANGSPVLTASVEVDKTWNSGMFYSGGQSVSYSHSGTSVPMRFEGAIGDSSLTGRLVTTEEIGMSDPGKWMIDVKFSAPIERRAVATNELTGDAARNSPPAKAVRKFLEAMTKLDAAGIRASIVEAERPKFDEMIAQMGKDKFLEMMKMMSADALAYPDVRVEFRGLLAEVILEQKTAESKTKSSFVLRQEGGAWRITQDR